MKRTIAALICVLLVFSLMTACSNDEASPTTTPEVVTKTPAPATETTEEKEEEPTTLYPVMEEKTTFTAWAPIHNQFVGVMTDYNDITSYQEMERLTNIHWKWMHPAFGNETENMSMIIASLDYPDMILEFNGYYAGGLESAIDEEIAIPLNDIVDQYMPAYKALLDGNADISKNAKTDSGIMGAIYCIYNVPQDPWYGLIVRKDWLDDLSLDTPETYDDWYNMLTAFKNDKGAIAPMLLFNEGDTPDGHFAGGYGVYKDFINQDGVVKYGPLEEGYKEYLQTMALWYKEGLIDQDFNTRSDPFYVPDSTFVFTGKSGAWAGGGPNMFGNSALLSGVTTDPNYYTIKVPNPVKNAGEVSHFTTRTSPMGMGSIITTACTEIEIIARWLDFQFTEEGALINNYGVEGVTYKMMDGEPVLSKELLEKTFNNTIDKISQMRGPVESPFLRYMKGTVKDDWTDYDSVNYQEEQSAAWKIDKYWVVPAYASPTIEEATEISAIMADINTFVSERTARYILGVDSFDNYDLEFVAKLKEMGIERAIEITQGYVTRYENR